jgi:hypothetical protein
MKAMLPVGFKTLRRWVFQGGLSMVVLSTALISPISGKSAGSLGAPMTMLNGVPDSVFQSQGITISNITGPTTGAVSREAITTIVQRSGEPILDARLVHLVQTGPIRFECTCWVVSFVPGQPTVSWGEGPVIRPGFQASSQTGVTVWAYEVFDAATGKGIVSKSLEQLGH